MTAGGRRQKRRSPPAVTTDSSPSTAKWAAAGIVLAGLVAYSNSLSGPFVLDDSLSIVSNGHIRGGPLVNLLSADRDSPLAGRPLVNLSFALNYAFGGLDVRGYHVVNILVHLLCALLVFACVRRTLQLPTFFGRFFSMRPETFGFAVALLWAVHPLNSEAVNYVTQRTESMMACFYLLTLYASIRALETRTARWRGTAVAACAAGMACKESMATAPLIVVLYDRAFVFDSFKESFRHRWRLYAGLCATWLLLVALIWSGPRGESAGWSSDVDSWTYLLNQARMITRYLRLAFWPTSLVVYYGWPVPLALREVLPQAIGVLALLVLTILVWRRNPRLGFLGAWFFIALAPSSSVVPIATEVGAERRMYLPVIALIVLTVAAFALAGRWLEQRWPARIPSARQRLAVAGGVALIVTSAGLIAGTLARNREYASQLSLVRTAVERAPSSIMRHLLGVELAASGKHDEAIGQLRAAVPGDPRASLDLGSELFKQGKLDEATAEFQRLIDVWRSPPATHQHWQLPLRSDIVAARVFMGRALAKKQHPTEAIEQYRSALELDPAYVEAHGLLADALFHLQVPSEAIAHFREYFKSRPDDVAMLGNFGIALMAAGGHGDEALATFQRAVALDPDTAVARRNLATALLDRGDIAAAAPHAERAVTLRPDDPESHEVLGRTLALQGKLAEARAELERALQLNPARAQAREDLNALKSKGR